MSIWRTLKLWLIARKFCPVDRTPTRPALIAVPSGWVSASADELFAESRQRHRRTAGPGFVELVAVELVAGVLVDALIKGAESNGQDTPFESGGGGDFGGGGASGSWSED